MTRMRLQEPAVAGSEGVWRSVIGMSSMFTQSFLDSAAVQPGAAPRRAIGRRSERPPRGWDGCPALAHEHPAARRSEAVFGPQACCAFQASTISAPVAAQTPRWRMMWASASSSAPMR